MCIYLEDDQVGVIHHSQLPEGLVQFSAGKAWGGGNSTLGGSFATAKPASLRGGRSTITAFFITSLSLEGRGSSLVKWGLAVKDVIKANPELLELDGLFLGQMSEATIGGEDGGDVGRVGSGRHNGLLSLRFFIEERERL